MNGSSPDAGMGWSPMGPIPLALDRFEKRLWRDMWLAPVFEAVEEDGIEARRYGHVQATMAECWSDEPQLNLILGAADDEGGIENLEAALEWMEEREVTCRVPICPERAIDAAAAEDVLARHGYEETERMVRWVRDASPPDFPQPPGIEVDEVKEPTEGFSQFITEGYGLDFTAACMFDCLPGRTGWRCYFVIDENEVCVGSGAMLAELEAAHMGFAAVQPSSRGKGCHLALLRRQIEDAAASRSPLLVAETVESLGGGDPSLPARNLFRAGFQQVSARTVWQRPRPWED